MKKNDFKIVFMGTPDFSVTILNGLLDHHFSIVGVVTTADKPAGRGQKLSESAVKKFSYEKGLNIIQPTNLKDEDFLSELRLLKANLFVVVAFRMLPEAVWNMPSHGTINLHASLLPAYRGAAPINWAIINGEENTGVTTFFIEKEIDTGLVIERESMSISENETAGELHDKLMALGSKLVINSVNQIIEGSVKRIPQAQLMDLTNLKIAPKLFKQQFRIDWSLPMEQIHNLSRGLSPYPTAWTILFNESKNESKTYKIFKTQKTGVKTEGNKVKFEKDGIYIPCLDFYLCVTEIQQEGKKKCNYKEFIAGYGLNIFSVC